MPNPRLMKALMGPFFFLLGMRRRSRAAGSLGSIKRALILRPDEIGDLVMTTALLRELRRNMPNAHLTLVVKPSNKNLVETCPYVDEIRIYESLEGGRFLEIRKAYRAFRLCMSYFWWPRYELALYPRWDADHYGASFLAYMSGAARRVAYSVDVAPWKQKAQPDDDVYFTDVHNDKTMKHEVKHNLELVRFLGGKVRSDKLELWMTPDDKKFAEHQLLSRRSVKSGPFIALAIGARQETKQWPFESYGELAALLVARFNATLVLLGAAEEERLGYLRGPVIDLRGRTTLRQAAAVLAHCRLYVGNDTGLMHISAAVGTAVVELCCHPRTASAQSWPWPDRFHPWTDKYKMIRPEHPLAPCTDGCVASSAHCITQIAVHDVFEACGHFLDVRQKVR